MGIDWDYDFAAHGWDRGGAMNPDLIPRRVESLKQCEENVGNVKTTTDGGWPRVGWGTVLAVDMRDGEPSVLIDGWMGPSWSPWFMIHEVLPTTPPRP